MSVSRFSRSKNSHGNAANLAVDLGVRPGQRMQVNLYRFHYTFETGHVLSGQVVGHVLAKLPSLVFDLKSLHATLRNPEHQLLLCFHEVYGQFKLNTPEVLLSGSDSRTGSVFSFNYRCDEASVFDEACGKWIASGWNPAWWRVKRIYGERLEAYEASSLSA
jgi:hypothetical protein